MKKNKHDKIVPVWHNRPFMSLYNHRDNQVYALNRLDFKSGNNEYLIIGTESIGSKIYDVKHLVKNIETGNTNWVTMESLIRMFKNGTIYNGIKEKAILY